MKQKSIVYFDLLNVSACLCVIGMHCNGIVHRFETVPAWYLSLAVEVLGYWAVPGFCMLSGATMLNYRKRYDTVTFLKRRVMKVGIPLILWTLVFYLWKRYTGSLAWTGGRAFLNMLINFEVESVYWFFAPLIMIYLSMPVLSHFADNRSILRYMILASILTTSIFPFLCNLLGVSYNSHFYFPLMGGYLMYPLLGYYLHTAQPKPWPKWLILVAGLMMVIMRYGHTAWTLHETGTASQLTWGYKNVPALLLSVSVFLFVKELCNRPFFQKETVRNCLRNMAGASFGIYLIHIFVMNFLKSVLNVDVYSGWWLLGGTPLVYGICFVCVTLLKKFPGGKYIFP